MKKSMMLVFLLVVNALTCQAENIDWKQQAEFYDSNYPDSTDNEKAQMLINSMTTANARFTTDTKEYTLKVTYVYDGNGRRIWPVSYNKADEDKDSFQLMEERAKELDKMFKGDKKSNEECRDCSKGSCDNLSEL